MAAAVADTGPLCAGIDPSSVLLDRWGLPDEPRGLREFASRCVEAFAGTVAAVKPQVAFFERFGSAGMAALERLLEWARDAELLVIADAKRADIENTMTGYATAWLDPQSPLSADAVTAVPYLGLAALQPMIEVAARHDRGVLVVVRSSNPEGRVVQEARTGSGTGPSVEDQLLSEIATANNGPGARPGTVGAVIGATLPPTSFSLATLGGVVLAPGVGAQGATAADVAAALRRLRPRDGTAERVEVAAVGGARRGQPRRGRPPRGRGDGRRVRRLGLSTATDGRGPPPVATVHVWRTTPRALSPSRTPSSGGRPARPTRSRAGTPTTTGGSSSTSPARAPRSRAVTPATRTIVGTRISTWSPAWASAPTGFARVEPDRARRRRVLARRARPLPADLRGMSRAGRSSRW